ncbi:MAG TPA: GNAT family N-acetyltransferase [Jiangellaceae bacterium]
MRITRLTTAARLFAGLGTTARLRDGRSVVIRPAVPSDAGGLTTMHARCSADTVYQRYHSMPALTGRFLTHLLSTDVALVAEAPNRAIVAMANLGRDTGDVGELAVLVEDGWQGAGIGTAMLGHLVTMARLVGYGEVYAVCLPGHVWCRNSLTRFGPASVEAGAGQVSIRLALREAPAALPTELPAPGAPAEASVAGASAAASAASAAA